MATEKQFPLALVIRAVDNATAPLRRINQQIAKATAPVRALNNSFKALSTEAGFPKLVDGFKGVGKSLSKVGNEVTGLVTKFGLLASGAAFAAFKIIKGAVDAGDELATMAQRVGLGVDAYASLQFAAAQADVEQEQFNSGLDKFVKSMGDAKAGTGQLLGFLKKVSPALARQFKGAKTTEEGLALMTLAFERVKDPARRAALASAAFGKTNLQFGQFLGQGSAEIQKQQAEFLKLAGSQEQFAKESGELDNAMRRAEMAFLGLRSAAAGALFPALTKLSAVVTDLFVKHRPAIEAWGKAAGEAITKWVQGGGVERLIVSMQSLAASVTKVVDAVGGPSGLVKIFAAIQLAPLVGAVANLGMAFGTLGSAVVPMVIKAFMLLAAPLAHVNFLLVGMAALPFVAAFTGLALAGKAIYDNWQPLKEFFSELWDVLKSIATMDLGSTIKQVGKWFGAEWAFGNAAQGRPMLGAAQTPGPLTRMTQTNNAAVSVDFSNLPSGARVTPATGNTAPLDLSLGYTMLGAQ